MWAKELPKKKGWFDSTRIMEQEVEHATKLLKQSKKEKQCVHVLYPVEIAPTSLYRESPYCRQTSYVPPTHHHALEWDPYSEGD